MANTEMTSLLSAWTSCIDLHNAECWVFFHRKIKIGVIDWRKTNDRISVTDVCLCINSVDDPRSCEHSPGISLAITLQFYAKWRMIRPLVLSRPIVSRWSDEWRDLKFPTKLFNNDTISWCDAEKNKEMYIKHFLVRLCNQLPSYIESRLRYSIPWIFPSV